MHNASSHSSGKGSSKVREAIDGLSIVAAGVFTFFVTPFAYGASVDAIRDFAAEHYSWTLGVGPAWWLVVVSAIGIAAMLFANLITSKQFLQHLSRFRLN